MSARKSVPASVPEGVRRIWSIGLYAGSSPLRLSPAPGVRNPILTRDDITDRRAGFVADPFLVRDAENWLLFFEVKNDECGKGEIGLAAGCGPDQWHYQGIVLSEPFQLSYPYVFEAGGAWYMIPETLDAGYVRIYRASQFPWRWVHVADAVEGRHADPSVLWWNERWWLFTCDAPDDHDSLRLFHSGALEGTWTEHVRSPLVTRDPRSARPAGRFVTLGQRAIRYAQDCFPDYGMAVRAFEIACLSPDGYSEQAWPHSPLDPAAGPGWNSHGMHHVSPVFCEPGRWIAAVDGAELKPA